MIVEANWLNRLGAVRAILGVAVVAACLFIAGVLLPDAAVAIGWITNVLGVFVVVATIETRRDAAFSGRRSLLMVTAFLIAALMVWIAIGAPYHLIGSTPRMYPD